MLSANVFSKFTGFVAVILVTRSSIPVDFGNYAYALSIALALVPFMGFGAYQAFLRYSPESGSQSEKKHLFGYAFKRGLSLAAALVIILQVIAPLLFQFMPGSLIYFRILAFVIVTTLIMEFAKSYARSLNLNQISAKLDLAYSLSMLTLTFMLVKVIGVGVIGYALAIVVSPLLVSIPFLIRAKIDFSLLNNLNNRIYSGFWRYGFFTSIGALLAQAFYAIDVLFLGYLIPDSAADIGAYRVAVLLPMATLILPISVAATDYIENARNRLNPKALCSYLINYWKTFGLLSFTGLLILGLIAPWVLNVFGDPYVQGVSVMRIFLLGMLGGHLLRVPLGHILSALGKADWMTYVNATVLGTTALLCHLLIPKFGLEGAACAISSMLWFSGVLYGLCFLYYMKMTGGQFE
jgi:O-antigen/teichoic acid export membrane protein